MEEPALYGHDLFGEVVRPKASGPVAERFTMPPFSILDARGGDWSSRKRAWIDLGIRGEEGRSAPVHANQEWIKKVKGMEVGRGDGTSVFDPVLTECMYRWFSPPGGQIVDPFAGGSVRGIVAAYLGRRYWGNDLSAAQIEANRLQSAEHTYPGAPPQWCIGDSTDMLLEAPEADFVFSCPPYGDLETYSDDPRDISGMDYEAFRFAYRIIIKRALMKLRQNRFAAFVVGDFRDPRGHYRNFVSHTIEAFLETHGVHYYNEAILATPVGTAMLRVTRQFNGGRKLAKTHQNIVVFVKGDWKQATRDLAAAGGEPPPTAEEIEEAEVAEAVLERPPGEEPRTEPMVFDMELGL